MVSSSPFLTGFSTLPPSSRPTGTAVCVASVARGHRPRPVAGFADRIEGLAGREIALGQRADLGKRGRQRHHVRLSVEHDAGGGQRHFQRGQVIGPEEAVVRSLADMQIVHALDDARMRGLDDDEDAGRHALADRVVDDALAVQDAAVLARDQHLCQVVAVGARAVHARNVGNEAGGVGDGRHLDHGLGAVDEFDEHARVHVAARRFLAIVVRHSVVVERVVLALAGRNDAVAERRGEFDQLHAARRLVARADRVDDAQPIRLLLQESADGDVGLDVHHHHMLAVLHRQQVEVGGNPGFAGRIDDDVDQRIGDQQLVGGDGDQAGLDRRGELRLGVRLDASGIIAIGNGDRLQRGMRAACRDGAKRRRRASACIA